MMDDIHIADGSTVKLLIAALVLASSVVGGLGLAYGTAQAGDAADGDDHDAEPQMAFPIDNVSGAQMAFPIDNVSGIQMAFPIDNVSGIQMAFPIDNVSGAQMAFPIDNYTATQMAFPIDNATNFQRSTGVQMSLSHPGQDMDPY